MSLFKKSRQPDRGTYALFIAFSFALKGSLAALLLPIRQASTGMNVLEGCLKTNVEVFWLFLSIASTLKAYELNWDDFP